VLTREPVEGILYNASYDVKKDGRLIMQDGVVGKNLSLYDSLKHVPHGSVDISSKSIAQNIIESYKKKSKTTRFEVKILSEISKQRYVLDFLDKIY
jgi:hypothetical protein